MSKAYITGVYSPSEVPAGTVLTVTVTVMNSGTAYGEIRCRIKDKYDWRTIFTGVAGVYPRDEAIFYCRPCVTMPNRDLPLRIDAQGDSDASPVTRDRTIKLATSRQVGLEFWNQTKGTSSAVDAKGTPDADREIAAHVSDKVLIKQPADTKIVAGDRVDLYIGEYGQPGTYVDTRIANGEGYWQFERFLAGVPESERGTRKRYFVHLNKQVYSDGIRLVVWTEPPPPPPGTGGLKGYVKSTAGDLIQGATVTCAGKSATSDASGHYEISDIDPGSYTATASKAGYSSDSRQVTIEADKYTDQDFALTGVEIVPLWAWAVIALIGFFGFATLLRRRK